jgi:hypothetical protein
MSRGAVAWQVCTTIGYQARSESLRVRVMYGFAPRACRTVPQSKFDNNGAHGMGRTVHTVPTNMYLVKCNGLKHADIGFRAYTNDLEKPAMDERVDFVTRSCPAAHGTVFEVR